MIAPSKMKKAYGQLYEIETGVKIQLEYELKSGQFLQVHPGPGKNNDGHYGSQRAQTVQPHDLCIRDLGCFDLNDFETIEQRGAFYLSRLKPNIQVYKRNETVERYKNGHVKKSSLYQKVDIEAIMNHHEPGEVIELHDVYLGKVKKLQTRLILYKLTDEQHRQRLDDRRRNEKKKGIRYNERTKRLSAVNMYMTNIPTSYIDNKHIHDLYSLRWQIEILFKTWKSIFHIDQCKPIKTERLECHVYGQLIAILLSSSLMFQVRRLLLLKKNKETSELKAIRTVQRFFRPLQQALQRHTQHVQRVLHRLFQTIEKNGIKSHRYQKETIFDILGVV